MLGNNKSTANNSVMLIDLEITHNNNNGEEDLNDKTSNNPNKNLSPYVFIQIYENFMKDQQRYVKLGALEIIGKFLVNIGKENLKNLYLEFYCEHIENFYDSLKVTELNGYYNNVTI